jgi:LmbE family N-acetylglucosaminyl deacetylase
MTTPLRLMAVLAHPDDESLGFGGTLARYAAEGVHTSVVTATRGEAGRYRGLGPGDGHPGAEALGRIREGELRAACGVLGVGEVALLGYRDQALDQADPREAVGRIVTHLRRVRPQVVITFAPDGAYGHPDHIAICQLTTAAIVAAADPAFVPGGPEAASPPHAASKLYYLAWPAAAHSAYEEAFRKLVSHVDGVAREASPWPDWALSCVIHTRDHWETVWRAVCCHESQITAYEKLSQLSPAGHEALWGWQSYYRAFSTVNGGRAREHDLFAGLRVSVAGADKALGQPTGTG